MNKDIQSISELIEQSKNINEEEKKAMSQFLKAANKELELIQFKLERTEKVKYTTGILLEETIEELEQKRKSIEKQKRGLEIEAALERVRSRTMGMQKSDELADVAEILFKQVRELGIHPWTAGFNIWLEGNEKYIDWITDPSGGFVEPYTVDLTSHPGFRQISDAKKSGEEFKVFEISGTELEETYELLSSFAPKQFAKMKALANSFPTRQFNHYFFGAQVGLMFITPEPHPEDWDIFIRFGQVFEQTYTRFLDLKKAEAQAKEAMIEAGLERVRSKTMSMHNSQDVGETVALMFEELVKLEVKTNRCGILILSNSMTAEVWTAKSNPNGKASLIIGKLDLTMHPLLQGFYHAWKNKESVFTYPMIGDDLISYYQAINNTKLYPTLFDLNALPSKEFHTDFYFAEGSIFSFTDEILTEEAIIIFKRFAGVFGQTYRRYLDLQKAEAQAREAQIEAALERVRSRAIAMSTSLELKEVALELRKQLGLLGQKDLEVCAIHLYDDENSFESWSAMKIPNKAGDILQTQTRFPNKGIRIVDELMQQYKKGSRDYVLINEKEKVVEWLEILKTHAPETCAMIMQSIGKLPLKNIKAYWSIADFSDGALVMVTYTEPDTASRNLLRRSANVFEQAYIRFLDLKKAEAQAREAQIELAMERVRARTMAMQKSEELSETVYILFEQFKKLGQNPDQATIGIINEDEWVIEYWVTMYGKQINQMFRFPIDEPNVTNKIFHAWKNQQKSLVIELSGKELYDFSTFRQSMGGAAYNENEKKRIINVAFFSKGIINVQSNELQSAESIQLLERFAGVFEQTYTRFLDLQKAEAQAREAQIEASLERMRSRSLAMYNTSELQEVIHTAHKELLNLNIAIHGGSFIAINNDIETTLRCWGSGGTANTSEEIHLPLYEKPFCTNLIHRIKNGPGFFTEEYTQEEKKEFFTFLFEHEPWSKLVAEQKKETLSSPGGYTRSCSISPNTSIFIINHFGENFSAADNDILKRFGKAFEQSYTRFLDIQKAEIQALETLKRASVDRVRAEIASMRTSTDLERITPIIWNELTTLGVPFIRCGVFIMDEENQQIQTMLSTAEGKAIASFQLPYENSEPLTELLPHWRKMEIYLESWDEKTFIKSTKLLLQRGAISSTETYATEHPPTNLHLHFLPFLQGMLYVGNEAALNKDELQLVQNLADAFSIAYARYEDFNKLESAKEQIEKTLKDLKATQSLLIQSEKMASLGELTAGIAHEIQNPLNFVNNFSEVNKELLMELKDEIKNGKLDDVMAIADDVIANEEKINHHGKRADSIVKGMLQHSRSSSGQKEQTDINALADEYLRLAYHGLRAKDKSFNATMKTDYDTSIEKMYLNPQDIGRVILNLITNAFYAVNEKKKTNSTDYEPTVTVSSKKSKSAIHISVTDNGNGVTKNILDKIFQPFFTTKPTGQGTGLGLSLSYDIVKAHGGEIKVETKEGEGTEFIIQLPS